MTLSDWADEILDMIRRRLFLILKVTFLGCVAAFLFAVSQAHQYTSTSVLQVQGAKVAGALTPPSVTAADARQLQLVEQQIMAHDTILGIAGQLGILDDLAGMPDSKKVATLREAVSISGVAAARTSSGEDGAISLVRISATWGDRESAQALAGEVARRTIRLSRQERLERARETLAFFASREDRLKAQIAELENVIARFRRENDLPESGIRESQDREIEALKAEILSIERQMIVLEGQIARAEATDGLTRLEKQQLAEHRDRLNGLVQQRDFLAQSLRNVAGSGQRDPALQIQLTGYQRELSGLQEDLRALGESREDAEIAYQLESQGQAEHLGMLEPASWPDYPSTPSRAKMAVLGAVASLLAALGLAVVLDIRNPVLRSAAMMERELGFRPIVTVPQARRPKSRFSLRKALGSRLRAW